MAKSKKSKKAAKNSVAAKTGAPKKSKASIARKPATGGGRSARITKNSSTSITGRAVNTVEKLAKRVRGVFSSQPTEITAAIQLDHDTLRNFIKVLKDTEGNMTERRSAYQRFAALLKSHTIAEETAVYRVARDMAGRELHMKVSEGYVEHKISEDLMTRIEDVEEARDWSAHANVLSELLEHHLDEEERDLFPIIRSSTNMQLDQEMLEEFLKIRADTQDEVFTNNAGALGNSKNAQREKRVDKNAPVRKKK